MSNIIQLGEEYLYTTIPKDYVYVYYSILTMLAELGEDMLKDCKATCKDRNSGIIECKNMFDAAIAARALGNIKLADTIIKYIKAKINQILGTKNEFVSYNFPVNGGDPIKYILDTNNNPIIKIDDSNAENYKDNLIDIINNCITSLNTNFDFGFGQTTNLSVRNGYIVEDNGKWYLAKDNYVDVLQISITPKIQDIAGFNISKDGETLTTYASYILSVVKDCMISTEVISSNGIKYKRNFDIKYIYPSYGGDGESLDDILGYKWYPIVEHDTYECTMDISGNSKIIFAIPAFYEVNSFYLKKSNGTIFINPVLTETTLNGITYNVYTFSVDDESTYTCYINK